MKLLFLYMIESIVLFIQPHLPAVSQPGHASLSGQLLDSTGSVVSDASVTTDDGTIQIDQHIEIGTHRDR